jgi:small subunit ribosomal protein S20
LANHKSALKRAGQNEVRRMRNRSVKTRVKTVVKDVRQAAADNAPETADRFREAQAAIDKAAKKVSCTTAPLHEKWPAWQSCLNRFSLNPFRNPT